MSQRQMRLGLMGLVSGFILMISLMIGVPKASATTQEWAKDVDTSSLFLQAAPDGSVSAVNCSQDPGQDFSIKTWNSTGTVTGTTPPVTYPKHWGNVCAGSVEEIGADGTLYIPYYDYTNGSTDFYSSLRAIKNNVQKWQPYVPTKFCSGVAPEISDVATTGGFVYLVLTSSCPGQQYVHELVKLSASNGTQVSRKNIGTYPLVNGHYMLAAHNSGLIVRLGVSPSFTFRYFDFNLTEATAKKYVLNLSSGEVYSPLDGNDAQIRVSPDGTLIIPVGGNDAGVSCDESKDRLKKLIRRTFSGTVQTFNLASKCFAAESVRVLPDGNTVFLRTGMSDGDYANPSQLILSVSSSGSSAYISAPLPVQSENVTYGRRQIEVDGNGNIVVARTLKRTEGEQDTYVAIDVLSSGGSLRSRTTSPVDFQNGSVDSTSIASVWKMALVNKALYLILDSGDTKLTRFLLPEIGMDYPRNVLLGVAPPVTTQLNYVALGDSFSSGEGAEPFYEATNQAGSASGNRCHRSKVAYGELLNLDPALSLNLQGFKACSGAETKHVWQSAQQNGDASLQVSAISSNTQAITMSIGGNDIGFKPFLMQCLFLDCSTATIKQPFFTNIANLGPALNTTYTKVLAEKSNSAKLYVVGYPQLLSGGQCDQTDSWMSAFDQLAAAAKSAASKPAEERNPADFAALAAVQSMGSQSGLTSSQINAFIAAGTFELSAQEITTARQLVTDLNTKIKTTVGTSNARLKYVDPTLSTSPFNGRELCTDEPYFNGVVMEVFNPETSTFFDTSKQVYSFHPNAKGQQAYARLVKTALG